MATGLAMLQVLLLAPGTKQRKGKSEQRPEAQEWAETVGDLWPRGSSDNREFLSCSELKERDGEGHVAAATTAA